jgi:hypothetical protein
MSLVFRECVMEDLSALRELSCKTYSDTFAMENGSAIEAYTRAKTAFIQKGNRCGKEGERVALAKRLGRLRVIYLQWFYKIKFKTSDDCVMATNQERKNSK